MPKRHDASWSIPRRAELEKKDIRVNKQFHAASR